MTDVEKSMCQDMIFKGFHEFGYIEWDGRNFKDINITTYWWHSARVLFFWNTECMGNFGNFWGLVCVAYKPKIF